MLFNHDFPSDYPSLTKRQEQVLDCLGNHMTSKEIARALGISPSMVDQHLRAISAKLGGIPRRELARLHADRGLRSPPSICASPPPESSQVECIRLPQEGLQPGRSGNFVAGFFTGFLMGILVVLVTIASVTVLMGRQ